MSCVIIVILTCIILYLKLSYAITVVSDGMIIRLAITINSTSIGGTCLYSG